MKKIVFILIAVLGFAFASQAQEKEDFKSKRGVYILPESGDIALGFNALPFFNYFGNMFNGNLNNNNMGVNFINNQAIVGKYYLSDESAVRGEVRIGYNSDIDKEFVMKDGSIPSDNVEVEDKQTTNTSNIHLGAGYEMRRGYGRVQGYFGGMATFDYNKTSINYEYGNPITSTYNNPNYHTFNQAVGSPTNTLNDGSRVTEVKDLANMGFGIRGYIGVEYFFAPKLSIGGEFGWGLGYMKNKANDAAYGEQTSEIWDGTTVETNTEEFAGDSMWNLDTDRAQGNLFLIFHF